MHRDFNASLSAIATLRSQHALSNSPIARQCEFIFDWAYPVSVEQSQTSLDGELEFLPAVYEPIYPSSRPSPGGRRSPRLNSTALAPPPQQPAATIAQFALFLIIWGLNAAPSLQDVQSTFDIQEKLIGQATDPIHDNAGVRSAAFKRLTVKVHRGERNEKTEARSLCGRLRD